MGIILENTFKEDVPMNKIFIIGRIAKEAELKTTEENKKSYTKFPVAVDAGYTNKQGEKVTDFFQVSLWGKPAEALTPYLNKGKLVSVIGSLRNHSYENKKYYTEILAEEVKFLEYSKVE